MDTSQDPPGLNNLVPLPKSLCHSCQHGIHMQGIEMEKLSGTELLPGGLDYTQEEDDEDEDTFGLFSNVDLSPEETKSSKDDPDFRIYLEIRQSPWLNTFCYYPHVVLGPQRNTTAALLTELKDKFVSSCTGYSEYKPQKIDV